MGKNGYLIDTNILIYYFSGSLPEAEKQNIFSIMRTSFNISIITKIELLGWKGHTEKGYKRAKRFLEAANIIYLDELISEQAIWIKRNKSIKLPDSVIAATALDGNYTILTRNESDFKNTGVSIYNPFKV